MNRKRQFNEEEDAAYEKSSVVLSGDTRSTTMLSAAPRICNVITVADEIRCSHAWPAGVSRSLLVEHIMPKIDSAATEHIVWSDKFFFDHSLLTEIATAARGCFGNIARALGKRTFVLSTWSPDDSRSQFVLHDVLYMPDLRINLILVFHVLPAGESYEVFF